MHAIFIPYGIKSAVDHLFMDMQAQKFPLKLTKPDGSEDMIWIQGSLRQLPFGVYEYVFPKESKDIVLTTLEFNENEKPKGYLNYKDFKINSALRILRKILRAEKPDKFDTSKTLLWVKNDVVIIPVGIREDINMTETESKITHEAL